MPLENILKGIKKAKTGLRKLLFFSVLGAAGLSDLSCVVNMPGPGGRWGCTPNDTLVTSHLGKNAAKKQRGIVYACMAGHIDIAHARNYAEWSGKYQEIALDNLKKNKPGFSFRSSKPVRYNVKIKYPLDWDSIDADKKQEIIKNVSIEFGPYLSYISSIMYETLTWFDWSSLPGISFFPSAFSWEDRFSDTFGCYVGELALRDKEHKFKDAINILLDKELERLGIQSKSVNEEAVKSIGGEWYVPGLFGGKMLMRNFDIGEGDDKVSPIIPPVSACKGTEPWDCPIPQLQYAEEMGFDFQIEIKPFAKKKIFKKILGKETINPKTDFPVIMDYIRKDAAKRGYLF